MYGPPWLLCIKFFALGFINHECYLNVLNIFPCSILSPTMHYALRWGFFTLWQNKTCLLMNWFSFQLWRKKLNLGKINQKYFVPKFWLFCHNFRTRNPRKPIKDSKRLGFSLVKKFPLVVSIQCPATWDKMALNLSHLWCHPQKTEIQNFPVFFNAN